MPYVTAAQLRGRYPDMKNTVTYTDSELDGLVAEFEEIAEFYVGQAFLPRTAQTETRELNGDRYLRTDWPLIRSVTSINVVYFGTTWPITSNVWRIDTKAGIVDLTADYTGTATIVYDHGLTTPPNRVLNACSEYVRSVLLRRKSGVARDVIVLGGDQSGTRYNTADIGARRPTGYSEVDRLLNTIPYYRQHSGIA